MADRKLKFRELRRILARFDVWEDPARGKGSHTMFFRVCSTGQYSYPIPTHSDEVLKAYVRGIRRRFELTADHGVSDDDFYDE